MGVSEACYIPAALATIADHHRGPTRSLATGIHMSGIYAGAALGGLGGYIAQWYGWRAGFSLFGAIGVVYSIVLLFFLRDARTRDDDDGGAAGSTTVGAALRALFGVGAFWVLLVLTALVGVANWGINGWLPTYLKEHFRLGLGEAGMSATGYIQVASFVGVLLGGAWADRWSGTNRRGRVLVPAIGFLAAGPCLFVSGSTAVLAAAIAGLIVYGLGRGFCDANLMPVLRQATGERYSATGYGLLNFVSCAMGGAMIYVGGWLKDAKVDLGRVVQVAAVALLLAGACFLLVRPREVTRGG
jgi:MFS family permease